MKKHAYWLDAERTDKGDRNPYSWHKSVYKPIKNESWISYKGYFSMEMFYKRIFYYMEELGFKSIEGDAVPEPYYSERRNADGSIAEIWYWWRYQKTPDSNLGADTAFRYYININVQVLGMTTEEIVKDGQKMKQNYGELNFFLAPYLATEFDNPNKKSLLHKDATSWKKDKFTSEITSWFTRNHFRAQIDDKKSELYKVAIAIHAMAKQHLGLPCFASSRPDMHPRRGERQFKL